MNCAGNDPYLIEYNVRMVIETESVMLRLHGDLAAACAALKNQDLRKRIFPCMISTV